MTGLLENFLFDPFSSENISLDDNSDPGKQFYIGSDNFYDTPYFSLDEASDFLKQTKSDKFFTLHLNIRSLKKSIHSLRILLTQLNFSFNVIYLL